MNKICSFNEFVVPDTFSDLINMDNSAHIAYATLGICKDSKINKIIALTETGYTPRVISSLRPRAEIIAVSDSQETINLLSMSRGVVGFKSNFKSSDLNSYDKIINELTQKGLLIKGEHVVAVHGQKFGEVGGTNSLMIVEI
jgi:pyruvate kinase